MCGGVKELANYFQMEYAMSFLMGLNDTFAQIRGQILLLDPPPPINKVFSLILQEECHKSINSGETDSTNPSLAFALPNASTRNPAYTEKQSYGTGQRKNRPFCCHCNCLGHTVAKCYKLHGYPPGYKPKQKHLLLMLLYIR